MQQDIKSMTTTTKRGIFGEPDSLVKNMIYIVIFNITSLVE